MKLGVSAKAAIFVLAALVLNGCSLAPCLFIINNTGEMIEIGRVLVPRAAGPGLRGASVDGRRWSFPWRWRLPVPQGEGREITYETPEHVIVELHTDHCDLRYVIPTAREHYYEPAWRDFSSNTARPFLKLQIEPDFEVYVVHEGATNPRDVEKYFTAIQPAGFPLAPQTNSCASED